MTAGTRRPRTRVASMKIADCEADAELLHRDDGKGGEG
jgi:hypothetical protein